MNINLEIVPKARIFAQLDEGSIDGAIFFPNPKYDPIVENVGMLDEVKFMIIPLKGISVTSYPDLAKLKNIGIMKGISISKEFDEDQSLKKNEVDDYEMMMKLFDKERIDALSGNAIVLYYLLNKNNMMNKIEKPGFILRKIPNNLYILKKSKLSARIPLIQKTLTAMHNEGFINKIIIKYAGTAWQDLK